MHLYIYYEVPLSAVVEARIRVRALQAALAPVHSRFLRRSPSAPHAETWMEIYEDVPDGFETVLADAVARHGIAELTSDRHVERFVVHD